MKSKLNNVLVGVAAVERPYFIQRDVSLLLLITDQRAPDYWLFLSDLLLMTFKENFWLFFGDFG